MTRIIALLLALAVPACGLGSDLPPGEDGMPPAAAPADVDDTGDFPLFDEIEIVEVYDPLEPVNRGLFWFNDKMYFYVLKPIARVLRYTPEPLRVSVKNFFLNLQTPVRMVNAGLQGKFAVAGNELTRFATNTTLGIGGLFDPAKEHFNIRMHEEDTGQTLGHYGVGPGPYLVLPFLGPSNLRDGIGKIGDGWLDLAYHIWAKDKDNYDYIGARIADTVNSLSLDKDTYEGIKRDALDPYLYVRDAHAQYRRNQIRN
ncbi:MAG: VacJ family lipoprotein [Gammaproteobacteria bacterium]|jgi:phospholipid-binding lipoprotein MlaA